MHLSQRICVNCSLSCACKWFSTDDFRWLCNTCEAYTHGLKRIEQVLESDKESSVHVIQERAKLINGALNEINKNSFVYTLPLVDTFKASIPDDISLNQRNSCVRSFKCSSINT